MSVQDSIKAVCTNKKVRYNYTVLKKYTAGTSLLGTEVKAIREGRVRIDEGYAMIVHGEIFLCNMYIGEYSHGGIDNHDPYRRRKLLLNRHEIDKLNAQLNGPGRTIVPLNVFFNEKNFLKVTIALVQGKRKYDKRDAIKKREAKRQIARAVRK